MAVISSGEIIGDMVAAFKNELDQNWPDIENYVTRQMNSVAQALAKFSKLYQDNKITQQAFKDDLQQAKLAAETTLITKTGLQQAMITKAINAALSAIQSSINSAVGFVLI